MRDRRGLEVLARDECLRRLGRGGVGRVAVSIGALPAIFPVNYATLDDRIVFRSGPGTKLLAATSGHVVAFEIDATDRVSHTGWSVMAVGPAHQITDPVELAVAEELPLASWVPCPDDVLVCIDPQLVSGRAITHASPTADDTVVPAAPTACPDCGGDALVGVSDGEATNFVCTGCFACWHVSLGAISRVPRATCPGCRVADLCRAANVGTLSLGA